MLNYYIICLLILWYAVYACWSKTREMHPQWNQNNESRDILYVFLAITLHSTAAVVIRNSLYLLQYLYLQVRTLGIS